MNTVWHHEEFSQINYFVSEPYKNLTYTHWCQALIEVLVANAVFIAVIFAIASGNPPVNKFSIAGFLGVLTIGVMLSLSALTGYNLNPARDLSGRITFQIYYAAFKPSVDSSWASTYNSWQLVWMEG